MIFMIAKKITEEELLQDKRVREEISRHLWFKSEQVGYDIGFDAAAKDWLENFSRAWMDYHMPKKKLIDIDAIKNMFRRSRRK